MATPRTRSTDDAPAGQTSQVDDNASVTVIDEPAGEPAAAAPAEPEATDTSGEPPAEATADPPDTPELVADVPPVVLEEPADGPEGRPPLGEVAEATAGELPPEPTDDDTSKED